MRADMEPQEDAAQAMYTVLEDLAKATALEDVAVAAAREDAAATAAQEDVAEAAEKEDVAESAAQEDVAESAAQEDAAQQDVDQAVAPPALLPEYIETILDRWEVNDLARSGLALLAASGPRGRVAAHEICFNLLVKLRNGESLRDPSSSVLRVVINAYSAMMDIGAL